MEPEEKNVEQIVRYMAGQRYRPDQMRGGVNRVHFYISKTQSDQSEADFSWFYTKAKPLQIPPRGWIPSYRFAGEAAFETRRLVFAPIALQSRPFRMVKSEDGKSQRRVWVENPAYGDPTSGIQWYTEVLSYVRDFPPVVLTFDGIKGSCWDAAWSAAGEAYAAVSDYLGVDIPIHALLLTLAVDQRVDGQGVVKPFLTDVSLAGPRNLFGLHPFYIGLKNASTTRMQDFLDRALLGEEEQQHCMSLYENRALYLRGEGA